MKKQKNPKTEKNPLGSGRNKIPIDWNKVELLATCHCTGVEIASFLGINYETLTRRFRQDKVNDIVDFMDYIHSKRSSGVALIKTKQFQALKEGNIPMAIWLGKQYADQSDKREVKQETKNVTEKTDAELDKEIADYERSNKESGPS